MTEHPSLDLTSETAAIAHMIVVYPEEPPPGADALAQVRHRREVDHHTAVLAERRARLARAFGEARGWRVSPSDFDEATLAAGKTSAGRRRRHYGSEWNCALLDHITFYRRPDRRAVAVVGQPYDLGAEAMDEADQWAAGRCLRITFPTDFPSWHYPGRTRLVLVEPALSGSSPPLAGCRAEGQG